MFTFATEQKVFQIGEAKVGGQPGQNPPLLIGNMFQKGDKILESRKEGKFDRKAAVDYIREAESLSESTGVPVLIAMVANTPQEMRRYVDFFVETSDLPFGVDIWMAKTRIKATEYIAEQGLQDRFLYNSITPWDEDIPGQVKAIRDMGIKHVVVQAFDMDDKMPTGRVKSLTSMLEMVGDAGFDSILADTAVMNLPTTAFSLRANYLIKEKFGLPAGCASANGTYMWKKSREMWGPKGFAGLDASVNAMCTLLWSDFLFYGPMTGNGRVFPAVATAMAMLAILAYEEGRPLPTDPQHPLNLLFPDIVEQLAQESAH